MTSLAELEERVARSYARLDLPSWPDPHPGHRSPRDEEYSRLLDPGKYRIVHARARAWTDALADVPGVKAERLAPAQLSKVRPDRFDRGVRLTSRRPGTLPLLLLERDVPVRDHDTSLAILHISVVEPEVGLEVLPDCGCDACDDGSARLLEAIDETVGQVVGGPFVVLRGERWQALWHPHGGSAGGERQLVRFDEAMDLCRRLAGGEHVRLPRRVTAYVGRSWLE